jgi:hypothetical membrane protein
MMRKVLRSFKMYGTLIFAGLLLLFFFVTIPSLSSLSSLEVVTMLLEPPAFRHDTVSLLIFSFCFIAVIAIGRRKTLLKRFRRR